MSFIFIFLKLLLNSMGKLIVEKYLNVLYLRMICVLVSEI